MMDVAIWALILLWFPMIYFKVSSIVDLLTDIRDILKKGGKD
jgi:hypothetical protein